MNKEIGGYLQIFAIFMGMITFFYLIKNHFISAILLCFAALIYFVGKYIKIK